MLTSVVIPCHDGADDTRACLQALAAGAEIGAVEVIVVDNGSRSPQALAAAAAAHPRAEVLRLEHNFGFAGGVNRGVEAARGDILVVLNNDTLPARHMLARLRQALEARPAPALVAPVSNYVKGSALLPVGNGGSTPQGRRDIEDRLAAECGGVLQDVDSLAGLCLMFRREVWQSVGPLDETFGLGNFEDDDFCLRVRLRGGRLVLVRDAFLHHWGSRTFAALGVDYDAQLQANGDTMHAKWQHDPAWQALRATQAGDLDAAGALAERALATRPGWPDGWLFRARAAHVQRDYAAAVDLAARHLEKCPTSWPGHVTHTVALLGAGRLPAAVRAARTALAACYVESEPAASLLTQVAHGLAARAEFAAAREVVQAALELGANGDRYCLLGSLCASTGDLAAAGEAFAAGAELGHPGARANLGACQWQQGQHAAALRTLGQGVREAPTHAACRTALAQVLEQCRAAGIDAAAAQRALAAIAV